MYLLCSRVSCALLPGGVTCCNAGAVQLVGSGTVAKVLPRSTCTQDIAGEIRLLFDVLVTLYERVAAEAPPCRDISHVPG